MVGIVGVTVDQKDLANLYLIEASIPAIRKAVNKVMRDEAKIHKAYLNLPAANWQPHHKPKWKTKSSSSTNRVSVDLKTTSTPYVFIWGGTRVRYRIMSANWVSKTRPGTLQARAGRGKAEGFGIAPGIEARNWHEQVFKIRESIFKAKLGRAITRALRTAFPAGTRGQGVSIA